MKPILFFILICILFAFSKKEETVSEWRGPHRSGIFNETNLLTVWPAEGPKLLWSFDSLGRGYGSPVFTDDQIFINGETDSTSYLYAFSLNGKLQWKKPYGNEWVKNFPGARSTPTVVGNLVYVTSGKGDLACLDKRSGEKKWALNMVTDLKGTINMFGFSQSVLINGDLLYCTPGGPENNIVALDRFTGKLVWSQKAKGEVEAYGSPLVIRREGRDLLLTFTELSFHGSTGNRVNCSGHTRWTPPETCTEIFR